MNARRPCLPGVAANAAMYLDQKIGNGAIRAEFNADPAGAGTDYAKTVDFTSQEYRSFF
jgi:hypothetical protein